MKKIIFLLLAAVTFTAASAQVVSKTETEDYLLNDAHTTGYYGIPAKLYTVYQSTVNFTPVDTVATGATLNLATGTFIYSSRAKTYVWGDTVQTSPVFGYGQASLAYSAQLAPSGANTVTATAVITPQRYFKGIWSNIPGQTAQTITCTYAGRATPVTGGFDVSVKDGTRLRLNIVPSSDTISVTGAWYLNKVVNINPQ